MNIQYITKKHKKNKNKKKFVICVTDVNLDVLVFHFAFQSCYAKLCGINQKCKTENLAKKISNEVTKFLMIKLEILQ